MIFSALRACRKLSHRCHRPRGSNVPRFASATRNIGQQYPIPNLTHCTFRIPHDESRRPIYKRITLNRSHGPWDWAHRNPGCIFYTRSFPFHAAHLQASGPSVQMSLKHQTHGQTIEQPRPAAPSPRFDSLSGCSRLPQCWLAAVNPAPAVVETVLLVIETMPSGTCQSPVLLANPGKTMGIQGRMDQITDMVLRQPLVATCATLYRGEGLRHAAHSPSLFPRSPGAIVLAFLFFLYILHASSTHTLLYAFRYALFHAVFGCGLD